MKFVVGQGVHIFLKGEWIIAGPRDSKHGAQRYPVKPVDELAQQEAVRWRTLRGLTPDQTITCSAKHIRTRHTDPFNRA